MLERNIKSTVKEYNNKIEITTSQKDFINLDTLTTYEVSLSCIFSHDLRLEDIYVNKMDGSMGGICNNAKRSLNVLVGEKIGQGFTKKIYSAVKQNSCMHYALLLQITASMAYRMLSARIKREKGHEAFLNYNKELFRDKCVGYMAYKQAECIDA